MTHEQMMEKSWRFIKELGITESKEEFQKNPEGYLVKNVYTVRDAYYSDLENGYVEDEEITDFFNRHNIKWQWKVNFKSFITGKERETWEPE